jgi:hypothetical protein
MSIVEQNPSLYIPYVYDTTTPLFVRDFIQDTLKLGRVDFISPKWVKQDTRTYIMMRVYFRSWNASEQALAFKRRIIDGEKERVVWGEDKRSGKELYWMVQQNTANEEQKEVDRKRYSEYLEKKRSFREGKRDEPRRRERSPDRRRERCVSRSRERSPTPPRKCQSGVIHYMDTCRCRSVSPSPHRDDRTPPRRERSPVPPPAPRRVRKVSRSPRRGDVSDDMAQMRRQIERQAKLIETMTAMMSRLEMPNVTVRKSRNQGLTTEPKRWSDEESDDEVIYSDDEDTGAGTEAK